MNFGSWGVLMLLDRKKRCSEVTRVARCSRRWFAKAPAYSAGDTALGSCGCGHSVPSSVGAHVQEKGT